MIWLFCAFCSFGLVGISHLLFQGYLFMQPCEQCVYIRYAFIVMGFGAIFLGIGDFLAKSTTKSTIKSTPKSKSTTKSKIAPDFTKSMQDFSLQNRVLKITFASRILGFLLGFYGSIRGIIFSILLWRIHRALNDFGDLESSDLDEISSGNIFGLQGCSMQPSFDFSLPLSAWFPSLFTPTGDCGQDFSLPPSDIDLSPLQAYFVEIYSQGWYLLPSAKFGTMAECCLFAFCVAFVIFGIALVGNVRAFCRILLHKDSKIC